MALLPLQATFKIFRESLLQPERNGGQNNWTFRAKVKTLPGTGPKNSMRQADGKLTLIVSQPFNPGEIASKPDTRQQNEKLVPLAVLLRIEHEIFVTYFELIWK